MKLVKEILYEKFSEDSDPIQDMGIGIISKIKDLQNLHKKENYGDKGNFSDLVSFCITDVKGTFKEKEAILDYLISRARNLKENSKDFLLIIFWTLNNQDEIIKYLKFFKRKNALYFDKEYNALSLAIQNNYLKVADYALKTLQISVNINNDELLSQAFVNNRPKTIKWLLKNGAKLHVKDNNYIIFKAALKNKDQEQIAMCAKAYLGIK